MSKSIVKYILIIIAAIFTMVSCTDHFEELNEPPTSVVNVDPGLLLTNVERDMAAGRGTDYWKTYTMQYGAWIQHWGVWDQNFSPPYYIASQDWHDTDWEWHYRDLKELSQAQSILVNGVEDGSKDNPQIRSRVAMLKILEVFITERLTSLLGDIPYSDAVQGLRGNINPTYDKQEDLYPALLDTLDRYISNLNSGDPSYGEADIIYEGNIEMWRRFGNSLKLRIGMRLKYANPSLAQATVTEAMGSSLISNNDESAKVPTGAGGGDGSQAHPLLSFWREPGGKSMIGETLINMLKDKNDPRLPLIAEPTANSKQGSGPLEYRGVPQAMTAAQADEIIVGDYSYPSFSVMACECVARPMKVLMYPEVAFLKAEAALEGWGANQSQAEGFYQDGIQAELSRFPYNVPQGDIQTYVSNEGMLSGSPEQQLEQIMTQKWLAFFSQSPQAFVEWRRTGFPVLDPGDNPGSTGGIIPRRGLYGQSEQALNSQNYNAAIENQGPDALTTRMWLDAN